MQINRSERGLLLASIGKVMNTNKAADPRTNVRSRSVNAEWASVPEQQLLETMLPWAARVRGKNLMIAFNLGTKDRLAQGDQPCFLADEDIIADWTGNAEGANLRPQSLKEETERCDYRFPHPI